MEEQGMRKRQWIEGQDPHHNLLRCAKTAGRSRVAFPAYGRIRTVDGTANIVIGSMANRLKVKDDLWSIELGVSCCIFIICVVGCSIGISGLSVLPKCIYGDPKCYLFIEVIQFIREYELQT